MTKIQALAVSTALAIGMVAPASAAQGDPEIIIYRFPGVTDNGGAANSGVATLFHGFSPFHLYVEHACAPCLWDTVIPEYGFSCSGDDRHCRDIHQRHLHRGDD